MTGRPPQRPDDGGIGLELLVLAGGLARRSGTGTRCGTARRRRPRAPGRRRPRRRTRCCPRARRGSRRGSRRAARPGGPAPGTAPPARRPAAIPLLRLVVGVEDDQALVAVDDRHPAVSGPLQHRARGRRRPGSPAPRRRSRCGWRGRRPRWRSPGRGGGRAPRPRWATGRGPARSSAPPGRPGTGSGRAPISWPRIRPSMSRTSAARAARWEPASRSSRAAYPSSTSSTACSAEIRSLLDAVAGLAVAASGRRSSGRAPQDVGILRAQPVADLGRVPFGRLAGRLAGPGPAGPARRRPPPRRSRGSAAPGRDGPAPPPGPWRSRG